MEWEEWPDEVDSQFATQCANSSRKPVHQGERAQIINLSALPNGARPMPFASLDYEEVPRARQLECPGYHRCLEFVASIKWQGFSCRRCPLNTISSWEKHEVGTEIDPQQEDASIIRLSRG